MLIFNVSFAMIIEITHQRIDSAGIKLLVRLGKHFSKVMKSRSKGIYIHIYIHTYIYIYKP